MGTLSDEVRTEVLCGYICNLEAENAKLKELLFYMWDFSFVVPDEPHTSNEELDYSVEVCKRMHELGIELF